MPDPYLPLVRVWDLPTRLFHWVLAITVAGSVLSAKIGGNAMVWHFRFGYVVFTLLAFRLLWGWVGGRWSRFASFVYTPGTVWRYLRGETRPGEPLEVGHNPLGSLSVLALLAVLAVQVGTGLVADDEIATTGPLNRFVGTATALRASAWHASWGQYLIIALVVLHVGAVMYYLHAKQRDLITPMWRGDKELAVDLPASQDGVHHRLLALVLMAAALLVSLWISRLGG